MSDLKTATIIRYEMLPSIRRSIVLKVNDRRWNPGKSMDTFAFIIHPIDPKRDVSRKFPFLGRVLTERQIDFFSTYFPPVYISEIEGITSSTTGKQVKGWFIAAPLYPPTNVGVARAGCLS
jgi:hypothetical protein